MICTLKRKDQLVATAWSGGSTTELFIYPACASYKERNFDIRLSSATIDDERSTFTALPRYHRILMSLNAGIKLAFEGHGERILRPFEAVEFDGAWTTTSQGSCTDIGIMLSPRYSGSLTAITAGRYQFEKGFACVYSLCDDIIVYIESSTYTLKKGDLLMVETQASGNLTLKTEQSNAAVLVRVAPK